MTITEETPRNYREATQTLLSEAKELFLKLEDFDGDTTLDYLQDLDRLGFLIGDASGARIFTPQPIHLKVSVRLRKTLWLNSSSLQPRSRCLLSYSRIFRNSMRKSKGAAPNFEDTIVKFRRAGVDRDEKKRRMIVEFKDQLTKLGQDFGKISAKISREIKVTADELKAYPRTTSTQRLPMQTDSTKSPPTIPTTFPL